MNEQDDNTSRRKFIQKSVVLGAGVMLANPIQLISQTNKSNNMNMINRIKSLKKYI